MLRILFDRWSKSSSFTISEIQVLEKLIPQASLEARKLLKQAKQAPYVLRKTIGHVGYEATIPYIEDCSLLVEANHDIESPSVETIDPQSGRRLRFSTAILRGGFLLGLRGMAIDGRRWPRKWCVGSEITQTEKTLSWLDALTPPMDVESALPVFNKLLDWSGANMSRISDYQKRCLRFAPSASDEKIAQCEARLQTTLADQYKQFVKIVNGLRIERGRPYMILGTEDLYYLDDSRQWLGLTPLYEDGCVALRNEDDSATCYLLSSDGRASKIGDLRQHVRESIVWEVRDEAAEGSGLSD